MGGWGSALGRYMRAFDSLWGQRHRPDVGYVLGYGDYGLGWSCRGGGRLKFRKLFEVPIPSSQYVSPPDLMGFHGDFMDA